MQKRYISTLIGLSLALGTVGAVHAANVLGRPNPNSQVGQQGKKNNQMTRSLDGKANRWRAKKVTNRTAKPPSAIWVSKGATIFQAQCSSCHGPGGSGTMSAPRLAAPSGIWYTFHTQSGLESFIRANMPGNHPGTLSRTQAKYLAAYVWSISRSK